MGLLLSKWLPWLKCACLLITQPLNFANRSDLFAKLTSAWPNRSISHFLAHGPKQTRNSTAEAKIAVSGNKLGPLGSNAAALSTRLWPADQWFLFHPLRLYTSLELRSLASLDAKAEGHTSLLSFSFSSFCLRPHHSEILSLVIQGAQLKSWKTGTAFFLSKTLQIKQKLALRQLFAFEAQLAGVRMVSILPFLPRGA